MSELTTPGSFSQSNGGSIPSNSSNGLKRRREKRAKTRVTSRTIPSIQKIGRSQTIWLLIAVVVAALLMFLLAGPIVNVNSITISL